MKSWITPIVWNIIPYLIKMSDLSEVMWYTFTKKPVSFNTCLSTLASFQQLKVLETIAMKYHLSQFYGVLLHNSQHETRTKLKNTPTEIVFWSRWMPPVFIWWSRDIKYPNSWYNRIRNAMLPLKIEFWKQSHWYLNKIRCNYL